MPLAEIRGEIWDVEQSGIGIGRISSGIKLVYSRVVSNLVRNWCEAFKDVSRSHGLGRKSSK